MQGRLNRLLAVIAGSLIVFDALWIALGHFAIDATAYLALAIAVPACMGASYYYGHRRNEPALSTMFAATAFLIAFPAACCLLSYLALTVTGPRIDLQLAAIDRSLGVSWPAIMAFAGDHPAVTGMLGLAYESMIPQTVLLVLLLGWRNEQAPLYGLCLAIAAGATATIAVWTAFPAFGAYSVYHLPPVVAAKLNLVENVDYGRQLTMMLQNGPGFISPRDLRGIIGFPSYHTVQAIVLAWYARKIPYVRWGSLLLNALVIVSTPIHGGHHVIDIAGGMIVAIGAIAVADAVVRSFGARKAAVAIAKAEAGAQPQSAAA
jgi:PAP2 superfamily